MANPYLGFRTYKESDSELFKGREEDIRNIYDYITNNGVTILYANSGIGKSSIINAGLCPVLRSNNFFPIYIRCNDYSSTANFEKLLLDILSSSEKLTKLWYESVDSPVFLGEVTCDYNREEQSSNNDGNKETKVEFKVRSIYVEKTGSMFCQLDKRLSQTSLWWFLRTREIYFEVAPGIEAVFTPLLIFDQFEEFFDKASSFDVAGEFFKWFNRVFSQITPPDVQNTYNEISKNYTHGQKFILDFDLKCKSLFSLRKEYIGQMDYWVYQNSDTRNTSFLYNRYLLRPLQKEQAEQVIGLSDKLQSKKETILNYIGTKEHDGYPAIILSVICDELLGEENAFKNLLNGGNVEDILSLAYERAIKKTSLTSKEVEDLEKKLVDKNSKRIRRRKTDFYFITDKKLKELLDYHIVTTVGEEFYELIHDKIAEVVAEKKLHSKRREKNRRRRENELNVLVAKGRDLVDNSLGVGSNSTIASNPYQLDVVNIINIPKVYDYIINRRSEISSLDNLSLKQMIEEIKGDSITIEFYKDGKSVLSSDGIAKLNITLNEGGKIIAAKFFDTDGAPLYLKGGYCGILLEYDEKGEKEVCRKYINEKDDPSITIDGYAIVRREYVLNNEKESIITTYHDINNSPCQHINGNYGFRSELDIDGFEEFRVYLDKDGKTPKKIVSGTYGIQLYYNKDNGVLIKASNVDADKNLISDSEDYITTIYKYDDSSGFQIQESYVDEDGKNMAGSSNEIAQIWDYEQRDDGFAIIATNIGKDNNPIPFDPDYFKMKLYYDQNNKPFKQKHLDEKGNVLKMWEVFDEMCFNYNDVGQISSIVLRNDTDVISFWFKYNIQGLLCQHGKTKNGKPDIEDDGSYGYHIDYITKLCNINDAPFVELWISCMNESYEIGSFKDGYSTKKEMRENGRVIEEFYYDSPNGLQIPDHDGIYGKRYDYSENNTITTINLDKEGTLRNNTKGICIKTEKKDDKDRTIKEQYFDEDHNPAFNSLGDSGTEWEFNDEGNEVTTISLGVDGKPHNNNQGYAYKIELKDGHNRKELIFDLDHNPAFDSMGDSGTLYVYNDEENKITIISLGTDGKPHNNNQGYAYKEIYKDSQNRTIKELIFDADRNPAFDNVGDCGTAWEYKDNKVVITSLGGDGMPHNNNQGYSCKIVLTDSTGKEFYMYKDVENEVISLLGSDLPTIRKIISDREEEIVSIDKDETPCNNNQGYAYKYILKDEIGRTIKELIFDVNHNPALDNNGNSGTEWEYNEEENEVTAISLGTDGEPHNNNLGFAYQIVKKDDKGRVIKDIRLDVFRNPWIDENGDSGIISLYNDETNETTTYFLGENGEPHNGNYGIAYVIEKKDSQNRRIMIRYFDVDHNPTSDNVGDYGTAWEYNDTDIIETTISLDADVKPHNNAQGYAYLVVQKDNQGRELRIFHLDADHKPVCDDIGDYGKKKEYKDLTNEVKTISLDINGQPHNNKNGYAYRIETKDKKNRTIKELFLDVDNCPAFNSLGDSGTEWEFNDEGNEVTTISLGADGKPHNNNQGYAYKIELKDGHNRKELIFDLDHNPAFDSMGDSGTLYVYNDEENKITIISLGTDGKPHNNNQGYAYKEIYKDSQNRTIKELIFDADRNPAFDSVGDSGTLCIYNDEDNKETTISLGVDGKPHNNNQGYAYMECTTLNETKTIKYLDLEKRPLPYIRKDLGNGIFEFGNLDLEGSPSENAEGIAFRRVLKDTLGRPVRQLYFDINHTHATNDIGDYGVAIEYIDNDSRCYYVTSLDINENPRINSNGFSKRYVLEDEEERVIKELTYGLKDEPVCDEDGCYGYEYRYTSNPNEKITISLGANESQIETKSGWTCKKEVKDTSGRVIEVYYYDTQNQPIDNFGFKIHYFDDENGTRLITRIGRDGNPSESENGICRIVEQIDKKGNEITLYYDLKGNRVKKNWWRNILKFLKIE